MISLVHPVIEHLLENKVGYIAPFLILGVGMGYMEYQITGLDDSVRELKSQYTEDKLIEAYTDLCMNPGNSWLIDRIQDLQRLYADANGNRYNPPPCSLLVR